MKIYDVEGTVEVRVSNYFKAENEKEAIEYAESFFKNFEVLDGLLSIDGVGDKLKDIEIIECKNEFVKKCYGV